VRFWLCLFAALAAVSSVRAAPPIEAYSRLPAIESVTLSPSGERFALVGRDGDNRRLYVRRADGQAEFIANLGAVKLKSVAWAGEEHLVVLMSSTVGGGLSILRLQDMKSAVIIDLKTQKTTNMFKDSKTVIDAVFGWFGTRQIGGRWYAFVGAVPYEKVRARMGDAPAIIYPDLYRVDLETAAYLPVAKANRGRTDWVIGPDGSIAGHSTFDAKGRVQTIYAGPGEDRPLIAREIDKGRLALDGLGRTADALMVGDRTSGEEQARELRASGPRDGEVLAVGVEDVQSVRDPMSGLMIGLTKDHGQGVEFIDPALQRRWVAAGKAFPEARPHLTSFTSGLDSMVVYTEGAKDPGTFWLVDIPKKSARPVGEARPEIKTADLGPVRVFAYKAADGLQLDGVLTLPPSSPAKGLPLIVLPPSIPYGARAVVLLDLEAQALASRGYAVLQPNPRGTVGYGEAFRKAAAGEVGRKVQSDLSNGVAALAAEGVIDPKRVCIVGFGGYGGYAALAGVTLQQGVYRCADIAHKAPMGPVDGEDLAAISPAKFANRADAPVLLIHDADNTTVPIEQAKVMERALKSAGKPVELVILPGGEHALSPEAARQTTFAAVLGFLSKHNPAQ
jgi:dipeptidyl aminopeptidase/acylaminoacyl peptidase